MLALGSIALFVMLIRFLKSGRFFRNLLSSAVWGVGSLTALSLTAPLTGLTVCITPYTLLLSSVFGLPGVICLTLVKMIWGV